MKRLFFAVVPPPGVLRQLSRLEIPTAASYGRAVPENKLHITVLFMAEVAPGMIPRLLAIASAMPVPGETVSFDKLEYWRQSGCLVLAASSVAASLRLWQQELAGKVAKMGIALSANSWQPHITLRREVRRKPRFTLATPVECPLRQCSLFASEAGSYRLLDGSPGGNGC